jgi:hypothetical protein
MLMSRYNLTPLPGIAGNVYRVTPRLSVSAPARQALP